MFETFTLGFCLKEIPSAVLLAGAVAALVIQQRNHKKRMAERRSMKERALTDKLG